MKKECQLNKKMVKWLKDNGFKKRGRKNNVSDFENLNSLYVFYFMHDFNSWSYGHWDDLQHNGFEVDMNDYDNEYVKFLILLEKGEKYLHI